MTNRIVKGASALASMLLCASAQTPSAPSFEVVSIRPHADVADRPVNGRIARGPRMTFSGPTARITGATLGFLAGFAYDLKPYEIGEKGWPAWKDEQFDIAAKAEGDRPLTRDQFRPLFQTLLAERFRLKFHREIKDMSGYMLTVAKNGPKIKQSDPDAAASMSITGTDCAEMTVVNWTMDRLVQQFSAQLGEPVLDGTGFTGGYDYKIAWSDTNSACATLVTALQEQLGLKLDRHKGPIQVFVLDSAAKPSLD